MKETLLNLYAFNLRYAHMLVEDVEDHLMTHSPSKGFENHPAFTIGHLISAAALTSKYLGGPYTFDPSWEKLFRRKGPGDPTLPEKNTDLYPSKDVLIGELKKQHGQVEKLILNLDKGRFREPTTWRFDDKMPTLGDVLHFMCITHESMHLGQLAAWRRAMDLPSALVKL